MTLPVNATVKSTRAMADIVAETPAGMVPMFWVTAAREDYLLSMAVYLKDGHLHECMTDQRVSSRLISGLHFYHYITTP